MLNNLCNAPFAHPANVCLPTTAAEYRKLGAHGEAISQIPVRCCFNCGMVNHPTAGDKILVKARGRHDLRAWRVYGDLINDIHQRQHVPIDDMFMCESAEPAADGTARCRVFTCSACKKERCQDPTQYDLFDGHTAGLPGQAQWRYQPNGVGEPLPDPLAALSSEDRLYLGVVKMVDAAFEPAYSSSTGYMHFSNGAFLQPGDYHGLSTLLVRDARAVDAPSGINLERVQTALEFLMDPDNGNPIVQRTLTCFERELAHNPNDQFPAAAGQGALPVMTWHDQELRAGDDGAGGDGGIGQAAARTLAPRGITGALQTVVEPPSDATLLQNAVWNQTVGNVHTRDGAVRAQPLVAETAAGSANNALHSVLYHKGDGAWCNTSTACDEAHFAKFRLGSINPKFRVAQEVMHENTSKYTTHTSHTSAHLLSKFAQFLWALYQTKMKKAMHSGGQRTVAAAVAAAGTQGQLAQQHALLHANPEIAADMTTKESFSGAVPKTMKGSKQYWRAAFIQLMAMCVEYDVPEYFVTFTANEMGWTDLRAACGGHSHGARPVEATRQYHHRWKEFKSRFLAGQTPIGEIEHIFFRHEEQARGSLHVHAAIWVKAGTSRPEAICATAPRRYQPGDAEFDERDPARDLTQQEREWRDFVLAVQYHGCRPACHKKHGVFVSETYCKGGYPRAIWLRREVEGRSIWLPPDAEPSVEELREQAFGEQARVALNVETDRYEYLTILEEDERLSTYIPLWLLAWGANMNIQYCTAAGRRAPRRSRPTRTATPAARSARSVARGVPAPPPCPGLFR